MAGFCSKKPAGLSIKPAYATGITGQSLRPWNMVHAEGVPGDYIRILERVITFDPLLQPVRSGVLIDIFTSRVSLCRVVGCDPHVVPNESRTSKQPCPPVPASPPPLPPLPHFS